MFDLTVIHNPAGSYMVTNPRNYKKFDRTGAEKYAGVVENVFAPLYPVLASVLLQRFHIKSGICIDIGSGTAALAIELARIGNLTVYAVDHADEIQNIAENKVRQAGMTGRVHITRADVLAMPFEDNFADLIVSRGSFIFWKKLPSAFNEIYRVMKPGGNACIGGGFGSLQMKDTINKKMLERNPHFENDSRQRFNPQVEARIIRGIQKSIVPEYEVIKDETGFWVLFQKQR